MSHNYYLYNDPTSNTLTWIPWDNNMALSSQGKMGKTKSFDQQGVNENWPLISFLIADPVYYQIYTDYLARTVDNSFTPDELSTNIQFYHDLIQPFVTGENGENPGFTNLSDEQAFESSFQNILSFVKERYDATNAFLAGIE